MKRRGPGCREAVIFLAVFSLGFLYYSFCGDPCPFHHDRPGDAMSSNGSHSHSLCLCDWNALDLPLTALFLSRIDCLGICPPEEEPRLPDVFLKGVTHPPQPSLPSLLS